MNKELFLKTAFCCMACDGDIAGEEIDLIRKFTKESDLFCNLEVESLLNKYVQKINTEGLAFLNTYIKELKAEDASVDEQLSIIKIAISVIESDNEIQYSEIKFFKRIRHCLSISDEEILAVFPDKEDYLLPDITMNEFEFVIDSEFSAIKIDLG